MCTAGRKRSTELSRSFGFIKIGENAEELEGPTLVPDDAGLVMSEGRPLGGVTSRRILTRLGVTLLSSVENPPSLEKRIGELLRGSPKGLELPLEVSSLGPGKRMGELVLGSKRPLLKVIGLGLGLPRLSVEGNLKGDTERIGSMMAPSEGRVVGPLLLPPKNMGLFDRLKPPCC